MKYLFMLLFLGFGYVSVAQNITGQWITYDDKTDERKAIIEIYQKDKLYYAKIVQSFTSDEGAICETCSGKSKGKPIIGLVIIEKLKKDGSKFTGGTIMDPENGKTYKCKLELTEDNRLKVRGYRGISLLGRTQYWTRKE